VISREKQEAINTLMHLFFNGSNQKAFFERSKLGLEVIHFEEFVGGPDRDRTDDLFHAMEARSQLRHRPTQGKDFSILADAKRQVKPACGLPAGVK
jgi:hypothetical protein